MSTEVVAQIEAGVAVLALNRPEHLNAYTAAMGASLSQAYRDCGEVDRVRAIVLIGAGRAFCAGADFSGASPFDAPGEGFSASLETELHHRVMGTDDAREGVNTFLERREPRFVARLSADWKPL